MVLGVRGVEIIFDFFRRDIEGGSNYFRRNSEGGSNYFGVSFQNDHPPTEELKKTNPYCYKFYSYNLVHRIDRGIKKIKGGIY